MRPCNHHPLLISLIIKVALILFIISQVALIDQLTEDEELTLIALDQRMFELERSVLSVGGRVLFDQGEAGYVGGAVKGLNESGSVRVLLDGEASEREVKRSKLLEAPVATTMREGQYVRVAFEHEDLPQGAMRWQYGALTKVHHRGELVNIRFDNGEAAEAVPTYDVECAATAAT